MSTRGFAAVVRRGLADQRRGVLIWGGSLGTLGAFMAAIYPSIQDTIGTLAKSYPSGLKKAFGISDLSTVEGYVHAEMFSLIVPLAMGFFAVRAVGGAIAGAEEDGRIDTILALPLPRAVLLGASFAVACVSSAAILAITGLLTFVAGQLAGDDLGLGPTAAGVAGVWPLTVLGAGLAALACGALHKGRAVMGFGLGTLVAMYALDVAGRLSEPLDPVRYVSAFHYYGAPLTDGIDWPGFALLIGAGIALLAAGALLFERRDIRR